MSDLKINLDLLNKFENELNPDFPEKSTITTKVLGYGEISTVLEIGTGDDRAKECRCSKLSSRRKTMRFYTKNTLKY